MTVQERPRTIQEPASTLDQNKAVARAVIERIFMHQEDAAIDELISPRFVAHTFGPMPPGREGLRQGMRRAGAGVSEARFEIHDMIAEGHRVAVRLTTSARHTGPFMGVEPTGNRYSIDEIHIFRIRDGQVTEHWHTFDKMSLLQQLAGKRDGAIGPGADAGNHDAEGDTSRGSP